MAQAHGFDNTVVIGTETTPGTRASSFNWPGIVESFDPSENNNTDTRRSVGVRAPFMLRQGQKEVDGSMTVALQNARLIAMALGNVETDGDVHTITPAKAGDQLPSVTVHNHNSLLNFTRDYVGGKVDTLTISASAEEAVTVDVDFMFKDVQDNGNAETVAAELDNYFMFYEGAVTVNGSELADVSEFEVEIGNGLERRFTVNQAGRAATRIEEGALEITASLTLDFTNLDQWDKFKNGEVLEVELSLIDTANADHYIKVKLTGGMYDTNEIGVAAEDLQEQQLDVIFTDIEVEAKGTTNLL
jgi:hypothetical protein